MPAYFFRQPTGGGGAAALGASAFPCRFGQTGFLTVRGSALRLAAYALVHSGVAPARVTSSPWLGSHCFGVCAVACRLQFVPCRYSLRRPLAPAP